MSRFVKQSKRKRIIKTTAVIALMTAVFFISIGAFGLSWQRVFSLAGLYPDRDSGLCVSFIDSGKADSTLITCNGSVLLIDAGEDIFADSVISYLERYKIEKIDMLVATHPDKDHIGGMSAVMEHFDVNTFVQPNLDSNLIPETDCYTNMIDSIESKNIRCIYPEAGGEFSVKELNLRVFSPCRSYDTTNDSSVVLKLEYAGKSFLFTGDSEKQAERDMVSNFGEELKSDVLKVSHHGSQNSTTDEFLQYVSPQYAVISVGKNSNNLPSRACLDRLKENGINIYRTDLQGNISFTVSKNGDIKIHTEK